MIKIVYITLVSVSNMVDQGRIILQNFGLCNLSIISHDGPLLTAHWDKSPLGQKPTGQYPTGQKPTAKFGRVDKSPL